ncbi:UDP-2,3-diacylglucosamine diphosphatase LpxI [Rhodobacteraceae bacterium NNCM2]|nr:UDP-2,3-diacylglucosamine diphosphatase LpxI [Coraliihabitans acroporae]
MDEKLAIIAGSGDLPRLIAEDRKRKGAPYLIVSFDSDIPAWAREHPHQLQMFEKPGRLFRDLRKAGVKELVFAGGTQRPKLRPWLFDAGALKVGARVLRLLRQGDDALLTGLAGLFEEEGFRMRGADELLPEIGVSAGILGKHKPGDHDREDVAKGAAILAALSEHDVGQGVVIARGLCLAVEAIEGTDAMLERVAALPKELRHRAPPPSGLLLKMPKRGQDRRVDLPTIGVRTVEGAKKAGLAGIAIEAGGTNLLDRKATVDAANKAGLFLWAVAPEAL